MRPGRGLMPDERTSGPSQAVRLAELPPGGAIALRADAKDAGLRKRIESALAVQLPAAGAWTGGEALMILWQAYDEWLIALPDGAQHECLARLRAATAGAHVALADVSDLRVAFELCGACSADVLRKGCAADLHPRVFGRGACAVTALARVRVTLLHTGTSHRILAERSYARYLREWLADALLEFDA